MTLLLDSFWRSVVYCLHPRVIALSFLPLLLLVGMALGLGYFFWEPAVDGVRQMLESSDLLNSFWAWLQGAGVGQLKTVVAPLIVIAGVTPVLVVVSLLVVALLMARRWWPWWASGVSPICSVCVVARRWAACFGRWDRCCWRWWP